MNGAMKMMMLANRGHEGGDTTHGGGPRQTFMDDRPQDNGGGPHMGDRREEHTSGGVYDRYDGPSYMGDNDDMESRGRRRDSRGRFRGELEDGYSTAPNVLPMYTPERHRMPRIGFAAGGGSGWEPHMGGGHDQEEGHEHESNDTGMGWGRVRHMKLTQDMADQWMEGLQNEDGTRGPHWSMAQTRQVMTQRSIGGDPVQFYAALNMIYSDYYKVLKKYGLGDKMDVYVDLACAWLNDKDAVGDKAGAYFAYAVRH